MDLIQIVFNGSVQVQWLFNTALFFCPFFPSGVVYQLCPQSSAVMNDRFSLKYVLHSTYLLNSLGLEFVVVNIQTILFSNLI